MHSFLSSRLRCDMWLWKHLPVLEKFENGRLPKIVRLPLDKIGSKPNRFSDSDATKNYCKEMKETLSLPGCSCK